MAGNKPFKILIADDNAVNLRVLEKLLKMRGYAVHAVNDGTEVIPALASGLFNLVILDCLMPGMDGYTTSRAIRAADRARINPEIPILAVTALASNEDRQKCLQAGMNDYISKPILADVLYRHVEALLGQGSGDGSEAISGRHADETVRFPDPDGNGNAPNAVHEALRSLSSRVEQDILLWQDELESLLERSACAEISFLAHKIRGTADLMEVRELSELAAELERAAKSEHKRRTATLVPQLVDALKRLRETLAAAR